MVTVPPRMAQKPMGMSNRDIGRPVRAEMRLTTGKKRAAAPTFCIKLEIKATVPEMMGMIRVSVWPPTRRMKAATCDMSPVLSRLAPMIMTAMMEMTALLAKPSNRWLMGTKPSVRPIRGASRLVSPRRTITEMAATSTPTTSKANRKTTSNKKAVTQAISTVGTMVARASPARRKQTAPIARAFRAGVFRAMAFSIFEQRERYLHLNLNRDPEPACR